MLQKQYRLQQYWRKSKVFINLHGPLNVNTLNWKDVKSLNGIHFFSQFVIRIIPSGLSLLISYVQLLCYSDSYSHTQPQDDDFTDFLNWRSYPHNRFWDTSLWSHFKHAASTMDSRLVNSWFSRHFLHLFLLWKSMDTLSWSYHNISSAEIVNLSRIWLFISCSSRTMFFSRLALVSLTILICSVNLGRAATLAPDEGTIQYSAGSCFFFFFSPSPWKKVVIFHLNFFCSGCIEANRKNIREDLEF